MANKTALGLSLAISVSVLLAGCESLNPERHHENPEVMVNCHGANSCKGLSDCATSLNACKGQNNCAGKGFVRMTTEECTAAGGQMHSRF